MGRPKLGISDLTDSNVDLFMYLIEGNRFGIRKVRRLNWALATKRGQYNSLEGTRFKLF